MFRVQRSAVIFASALAVAAMVLSGAFTGRLLAAQHHGAAPIAFGPTTTVDDQRLSGEPDIKVCGVSSTWSYGNCGQNDPYASVPWGFSTTSSFIWRSEDQGKTFKLVPSNNTTGKPNACPGGGDTDLGITPAKTLSGYRVNFEDLQGLTNFSAGVSTDGGTTFTCNPVSAEATAVDRQWFGFDKVPGSTGSAVYLDYDIADGGAVFPTCVTGTNSAGNVFVVQKSTDGGLTYGAFTAVDCNDGIAGNMQVNQKTGHVFAIHTAYTNPTTCTNSTDAVVVNKSVDGGTTWTKSVVYKPAKLTATCGNDVTVGQDFAVLAIDDQGGLYAIWSQASVDSTGAVNGPSHIYYSYSGDDGKTWTPEQQVDSGVKTNVDVFPWITAGDPGRIDIVWYGTTQTGKNGPWDPGSQTTDWSPYLTQSLNANGSHASFSTPRPVAQHPNHNGGICTMGLGCTTGGDRSLADFFQVDHNSSGGAVVIWADTSNNSGSGSNQAALIEEAQQTSGPGLFSGKKVAAQPGAVCTAVGPKFCQKDQTGDAKYEANGMVGSNVSNLDITRSAVNLDPTNPKNLDVRMKIANLKSLPSVGESGLNPNDVFVDYLTSWVYHNPKGTQTTFDSTGNTYFAYLEVNTATGSTTAMAGNTCSISTTHGKYLVYPGSSSISSKIDGQNGTIDLSVPLSNVGSPAPGASLYSVTAHTVGQPAPAAGPGGAPNCVRDVNGNNQDPTGQIFDVYDKSPAYTSILKSLPTLHVTGGGHQSHHQVNFHWKLVSGQQPLSFNVIAVLQGGKTQQMNSQPIPAHSGRSYSFTAHKVHADVDSYNLELNYSTGTVKAGPFTVTG